MTWKIFYLHFYIADRADDETLDDLIAGWTRLFNPKTPNVSHVELEENGICFSSTLRDKAKGVRFAKREVVLRNPNRWITLSKRFSVAEKNLICKRAKSIEGRPYYKVGIVLDYFMPFALISKVVGKWLNQWYCSMADYFALTGIRRRISPRRMYKWAIKNGWLREGR